MTAKRTPEPARRQGLLAFAIPLVPAFEALALWQRNDAIAAAGLVDQTTLSELAETPLLVVAFGLVRGYLRSERRMAARRGAKERAAS